MTLDSLAINFMQAAMCFAGFFGFSVGLFFGYKVTYEK